MSIFKKIIAMCGGDNKYNSIAKIESNPHGLLTTTIRTNIQEISNGNTTIEMAGYMFGKWLVKNTSEYFSIGLYKALKEDPIK